MFENKWNIQPSIRLTLAPADLLLALVVTIVFMIYEQQIFFHHSPHSLNQTISKAKCILHVLFSEKSDGLINAYGFRVEYCENFREKNMMAMISIYFIWGKKKQSYKSSQLTVEWELFPRERVRS